MTEPPTPPPAGTSRPPEPPPTPARPPEPPEPPKERDAPLGTIAVGVLLVLIGLGWLLQATDVVDVPWGALLPAALIVVGVTLMIASRRGGRGGLIGLGVVLTILTVVTSGLDVPLRGGIGQRNERPASSAELQERYDLAIGQLNLDLTGLEPEGTTEIEASVGIGELVVDVPEDVEVRVRAGVSLGDVQALGRQESGVGPEVVVVDDGYEAATERISLRLSVGLGSLKVER